MVSFTLFANLVGFTAIMVTIIRKVLLTLHRKINRLGRLVYIENNKRNNIDYVTSI